MYSSSSSIICTKNNTYCISNDHCVYVFGKGKDNKLNKYNMSIPILIEGLHDIKMIDCGISHILCLNFEGSVFSLGINKYKYSRIDNSRYPPRETHIPQKLDIPLCKQIACGNDFSMCLTEDNVLYSFGNNYNGELGLDDIDYDYNSPRLIPNLHNIEYIVCGGFHSICKTYDNTYYGWGRNYYGQLGHDEYGIYKKPTRCTNYPDNIISIKCGVGHTLLLTLEGNIYSFGDNEHGELGLNDNNIMETNTPTLIRNIPEIRRIECGDYHSICIDVNNDLWLFGGNSYGQLGVGNTKHKYTPIKHPTLSNIMDISSRGYSTFIKTLDQKIFAFGANEHLHLGIETNKKCQLTPIQVFQGKEDIWCPLIGKSKQKSARK